MRPWLRHAAAVPMLAGGIVFVIGAVLAGMGLSALADGIAAFTERGMIDVMWPLSWKLLVFALGMLAAALPLLVASPFILLGGLIMGAGLAALAWGIEGFTQRGMIEAMTLLGAGIWAFSTSMLLAGWALLLASPFILLGGIMMGLGLAALGFGINMFDKSTLAAMIILGMFWDHSRKTF